MSFDPKRMVCVTCPDEHVIMDGKRQPVCIVLSDHNFSPCVPAGRGETCMVIVRAEDGLLADLEYIFRDVFRNFSGPTGSLPPGSIILLGSTSHLSLLGLSSYTEDYAKICSTLIGLAGPSVIVCPMIQILLSGVSSAETIRDMVNLDAWIMAGKPQDNIVLSTFRADIWETLCSNASDFVGKSPPS